MSKDPRDPYRHAPSGLTEEERREWWERRKFVWEPGDVRIIRRAGSEKPEGEDDEYVSPGR